MDLPKFVNDLRKEVRYLRQQNAITQRAHLAQKKGREELIKERDRLREENRKLEKEIEKQRKERDRLEKEIEKLLKTNNRYQIALFDHGNFKSKQASEKKRKGGQVGHRDTNREKAEDYSLYERKRVFANECGHCNSSLPRVTSTTQKILLDIVINPDIVKLVIESERQWCGTCKKEVHAKDPNTLPFTEYGINTFLMVMILRFKAHASLGNTSTVLRIGYGLSLSKSDVSNLLKQAKNYLRGRYDKLITAIRKGQVMYKDETGWLVHGEKAWMWIMANDEATVYIAAESRGKGIAEEMYGDSHAFAMTDGYVSYTNTIPKDKHLYCWAHMLRFAHEETIHATEESMAYALREELVSIYHLKKEHTGSPEKLKLLLEERLEQILSLSSEEVSFQNIQNRLKTQKEGLIYALLVTQDGTNNLAERELRNMAIKRTISNGSDTFLGMETTAIIGSVIQTLSRKKDAQVLSVLNDYLKEDIQERYWQYKHIPITA